MSCATLEVPNVVALNKGTPELKAIAEYKRDAASYNIFIQTGVRFGHYPKWLTKLLRRHSFNDLFGDQRWFDHPGRLNENGIDWLTTHPYVLDSANLKQLNDWCERFGCDFTLSPQSPYAPGHTMMVMIMPAKN